MKNIETIDTKIRRMNTGDTHHVSLALFRIVIAFTIVIKMLMTIPFYHSIYLDVDRQLYNGNLVPVLISLNSFCIFIVAGFWLVGLQNKSTLFLLFVMYLIHIRTIPFACYGGDYVTSIILLFVPFLNTTQKFIVYKSTTTQSYYAEAYALAAIRISFCIIYLFSGVNKLMDIEWLKGNALSVLLKLDFYNGTPFNNTLAESGVLAKMLTWVTLFIELLVPFTIWTKKLKKLSILAALSFHVFIAIFMHIYRFEMVMIAIILLFLDDTSWNKIPGIQKRIASKKIGEI